MMKVLFVTHTQDMSGANRSMMQLIKELHRNHGVEPFVVMPRIKMDVDYTLPVACKNENIPFIEHKMTHFKRHENCTWVEKLYFICVHAITTLHILWLLRNYRFDLVHTNASVSDAGAYISRWKKIPHVWHLREFGKEDFGLVSCLGKRYERWTYSRCDKFIAISEVIKNAFSDVIPCEKITTIYNGILPHGDNMLARHESETVRVCIVGRVESNKNQMEALQAMAQLKKQGYENVHLSIIGRCKEKDYGKKMDDFIAEQGLQQMVDVMGMRFDVPELLKGMDIGLMLSTNEAFGRVTVEYQLQNLAVVATDAGANAELIQPNKTGLLYTLGDVEALVAHLKTLITDRNKLNEIACNGRMSALNNFTSEKNSRNIYALYEMLMRKTK